MSKAFICMHESEAGFDSSEEAMAWLDAIHAEDRNNWRVVEVTMEPVTQRMRDEQHASELEAAYIRGVEMERKLMRLRLGLAVAGD
jgi:hypothetical protein